MDDREISCGKRFVIVSAPTKDFFSVLMTDDSEDDRYLLKKALRRATKLNLIGELTNGQELITYLKHKDRVKYPAPDLLLLDLKMPLVDGFEALDWIRNQSVKTLSHITVVVLTDSMHASDIKRALDLGADLFQVKPRDVADRESLVLALEEYMVNALQTKLTTRLYQPI